MAHARQGLSSNLLLLKKILLLLPSAHPLEESLVGDGVLGTRIFPGIINAKASRRREVKSTIVGIVKVQQKAVGILYAATPTFLRRRSSRRTALRRVRWSIIGKGRQCRCGGEKVWPILVGGKNIVDIFVRTCLGLLERI